ncbi:transporter substrate-binding domain-containing protein [Primorskyibacter sp. S187A]|uniref:transporter substrate-binding domain-containing protein n=1 Tax=Primorskyibacter sp. S187A TaxID=3415130 RepID=UPI003C7DFC8D
MKETAIPQRLENLPRGGALRAAINTGNRALVQQGESGLHGISPALARRLATELGVQLEPVVYDGAGQVFEDADRDRWDVAFLAVDPKRAEKVAFTRPYITIEATFAVRAGSAIEDVHQVDRDGLRLLTSKDSAYDLHLSKMLQHAKHDRSGTPSESFERFRSGGWDAVAGVRASLEQAFGADPDFRILPGVLTKVEQAMVLPGHDHPLIDVLDAFVGRCIADGFVASVPSGAHVS